MKKIIESIRKISAEFIAWMKGHFDISTKDKGNAWYENQVAFRNGGLIYTLFPRVSTVLYCSVYFNLYK